MDDQTRVGSPGTAPKKSLAGHELNEFAWSVLDGLPTACVVCEAVDVGLRIIYHNPRFREILQLPDDVIAGATLLSLVEDGIDAGGRAKLHNPAGEFSIRCELAPGVSGLLRLRPHPTAANYWIGSLERLPVAEASRGILETLFNASHNLVTAKDTDGRYVMVNSAFAEFIGKSMEDILGRTRVESNSNLPRLARRAATPFSKAEQEALRSARPIVERGKRIVDANGRERAFDVVRTPVLDEHGEVQFLIGVGSDSTETEYWTHRYQTQRDLLGHLMDSVPDPIWVSDRAGQWVLTNRAFKDMVGSLSGQAEDSYGFVADRSLAHEMRNCDLRVIDNNKQELVRDVTVGGGDLPVRWLDVWKAGLQSPDGDARWVVSVAHDITKRHQSQAILREQIKATRLIAKVSSLFVSQLTDRVDDHLISALREVAEFAGAFRCIIRELPRQDGADHRRLEWRSDGLMGDLEDTAPWELPWLMSEMQTHGYVLCESVADLPVAAEQEIGICQREGISAFIATPLKLHGTVNGILFVNRLHGNPDWSRTTAESIATCADILAAAIERAETQRRLVLASSQLREIATSVPGAIFQWGMSAGENHLNYVSEGISTLTGLDYAAVVEEPGLLMSVIDTDSRRAVMRRAALAAERVEAFQMEVPITPKGSAARRWVKLSVSARSDGEGRILLDGLINDVTDVKVHEQALLAARNQLEGVTRSIPGMVYQARYKKGSGGEPILSFASRGTQDVWGLSAQEIIRDPGLMRRMVLVEDLPSIGDSLQRAVRDLKPWQQEFRIRDASGKLKWIQALAVPTATDTGDGVQLNGVLMDASDRARTVDRLRDAEDQLRDLTGSMPGFVFRIDVSDSGQPHLTYVSEGAAEIYAMPAEDVLALSADELREMVIPEDRDLMTQAFEETLRTGTTVTLERRLIDALGNEHWLQSTLRPKQNIDGPASLVGVTLDVTERKRAEIALAAAEQRVSEVTQALPGTVFQFHYSAAGDLDIRYLEGRTITGRPAESFALDFNAIANAIHPEDHEMLFRAAAKSAKKLTPLEADFRVLDVGGEMRWGRVSAYPTRTVEGGTLFNGFALDITGRKKADEALRMSEERYRAVVQDQSDIVCRLDKDGRVLFANAAGLRFFGNSRHAVGRLWWELLPPGPGELAREKLLSLTAESPAESVEVRTLDQNGEAVWHQWNLRAFLSSAGTYSGFQAVGRDVSELKSLERQVRSVAEREQQRIGHDLHDGLGQELTGLSLLLKGLEHGAKTQVPKLLPDIRYAQEVLNDSIASARALAQGLSPVHLERDGLAGALEQLAANVESLHKVPVVVTHRGRRQVDVTVVTEFYRIAQEAVNNAARHAQATRILVDLDLSRGVRLVVSDDGSGHNGDGSDGMGLRIMHYRADLLGAMLSVTRDEGKGTVVMCQLTERGLEGTNDRTDS